jgi:hypothetical protein
MKPSYFTASVVGAVSGLVLALAVFTYLASAGAIRSLTTQVVGADVVPTFSSSASATWLAVIIGAALGGATIAVVTKAVALVVDPDSGTGSLLLLVPLGIAVAGIVSMIVFPLGVTVLGSISEGNANIGVANMVVLVSLAGAASGGSVAFVSYVLVRPPAPVEDTELLTL